MREVDPDPAWHEMRRLPKKLFRKLGELRDTQIMDEWVAEHGAENDKLRVALHNFFQEREPELLREALRLASKFDGKSWQRLERKLHKRMRLVPSGSLAAQCLAVERLNEAKELHSKAMRADKPAAWEAPANGRDCPAPCHGARRGRSSAPRCADFSLVRGAVRCAGPRTQRSGL